MHSVPINKYKKLILVLKIVITIFIKMKEKHNSQLIICFNIVFRTYTIFLIYPKFIIYLNKYIYLLIFIHNNIFIILIFVSKFFWLNYIFLAYYTITTI